MVIITEKGPLVSERIGGFPPPCIMVIPVVTANAVFIEVVLSEQQVG